MLCVCVCVCVCGYMLSYSCSGSNHENGKFKKTKLKSEERTNERISKRTYVHERKRKKKEDIVFLKK